MSTCYNNLKNPLITKINKHKPSCCSLFTRCSLDLTKNNFECYKGKDCRERFCKDLKKHAKK